MTLREKQSLFLRNICKHISWSFENGYEITIGEAARTNEQQLLYFEGYSVQKIGTNLHFVSSIRKTRTMQSQHLNRLAIDLNYFINGIYIADKDKLQKAGDHWESLHPLNSWGGNWKTFLDTPHFEMK